MSVTVAKSVLTGVEVSVVTLVSPTCYISVMKFEMVTTVNMNRFTYVSGMRTQTTWQSLFRRQLVGAKNRFYVSVTMASSNLS